MVQYFSGGLGMLLKSHDTCDGNSECQNNILGQQDNVPQKIVLLSVIYSQSVQIYITVQIECTCTKSAFPH